MTQPALKESPPHGNAVSVHFKPQSFADFAEVELATVTPWVPGVCFLPECGAAFRPARAWQYYCCDACHAKGTAEMRRWGHRLAIAALTWRMGKDRKDTARRNLANAGKRYMLMVLSDWMAERETRATEGRQ